MKKQSEKLIKKSLMIFSQLGEYIDAAKEARSEKAPPIGAELVDGG